MDKNYYLNQKIIIYWWNHGEKKLDFSGTYKQWFIKNNITVIESKGYLYFNGSFGSMSLRIKFQSNDYEHTFKHIIKLCLMYLGDQALLIDSNYREYKINWR